MSLGFLRFLHGVVGPLQVRTLSGENRHESARMSEAGGGGRCVAPERDMLTPLAGAETLLCFLACLTYFLRPDKLQRHETRLYVWPGLHPGEGRVDLEERPVSEQVICPRRHTLLKGQIPYRAQLCVMFLIA